MVSISHPPLRHTIKEMFRLLNGWNNLQKICRLWEQDCEWEVGVIFRMSQVVDISNARSQTIYNIYEEMLNMWQKLKIAVIVNFYIFILSERKENHTIICFAKQTIANWKSLKTKCLGAEKCNWLWLSCLNRCNYVVVFNILIINFKLSSSTLSLCMYLSTLSTKMKVASMCVSKAVQH